MFTRKIYATGSATGNGLASIVVPRRTRLVQVQWSVWIDSITDNSSLCLELSLAAATEIAVNDAQQAIAELRTFSNFVTSGSQQTNLNSFLPVDVEFEQGQKLYLHGTIAGTLTFTGGAILVFK